MSSTRIAVQIAGNLNARSEPTGAESGSIVFGAEARYAASAWVASSVQARVSDDVWTALPWQAGLVAKVIGIQVRSKGELKVRCTRQVSAQIIAAAAPLCLLTFPDLDGVTLLEVAGAVDIITEFEWLAAGD